MIYNNVNGKHVSKIGLGYMRHNNNSNELTKIAIENGGINYFEACTFYLNNNCENIVKNSLQNYDRNSYYLCDKISILGENFNILDLELFFETQLQKLGVDYFDFYLLQALDRNCINILKSYPIINFFNKKRDEKKIHNLGFSFHDTSQYLEYFLTLNDWDCVQLSLNYYDWYMHDGKNNYYILKNKNIPIIVMSPCKGGLLTDRLPVSLQENFNNTFPNKSLYELCFSFLQQLDNVKIILTGANNSLFLKQVLDLYNKDNQLRFTNLDYEIIQIIINNYFRKNNILCTQCNYCINKCPNNIDISKNFCYYNNMINTGNKNEFYNLLKSPQSFLNCCNCGECEKICPQHLPIRELFHNNLFLNKL